MAGADHWSARTKRRVPERSRIALALDALGEVGLAGREDQSVDALSFGDRRLVELARVIASRPRLVLLDEPSSGLNDMEVEKFKQIVRRLQERDCTVVLVEHNLPLVRDVAQEVIAIDRGRLLVHGATAEVFEHPGFREAYIGTAKAAA
jgi:ABC-type branched-subunit amino acid transport system ATPase component